MKYRLPLISCLSPLLFASSGALAMSDISYLCDYAGEQRVIEVKYTGEGQVPCEVHYQRNGLSDVVWQAMNQAGYCEEKASAFVEKQRGWGWQCEQQSTQAPADEPTETATEETPSRPAAPSGLQADL